MNPALVLAIPFITLAAAPGAPLETIGDLAKTFQGCFRAPDHMTGSQVTVRFRLNERGVLQGRPQIASSASIVSEGDRRALDAAVLDALRRCTPLSLSPTFGTSVAGRILTLHLVGGPPPQGI